LTDVASKSVINARIGVKPLENVHVATLAMSLLTDVVYFHVKNLSKNAKNQSKNGISQSKNVNNNRLNVKSPVKSIGFLKKNVLKRSQIKYASIHKANHAKANKANHAKANKANQAKVENHVKANNANHAKVENHAKANKANHAKVENQAKANKAKKERAVNLKNPINLKSSNIKY
jgi:hypothetical protein